MSKAEMIEVILAAVPTYTPESGVYQNFASWLERQSRQNVFMLYLIIKG